METNTNCLDKRDKRTPRKMYRTSSTQETDLVFRNINITEKGNHILKNVSGMAKKGEILGILGPRGSGKTCLLTALGGQLKPYVGDILIGGKPLEQGREEVALVECQDWFLPSLTVVETLLYATYLLLPQQTDASERQKRITQALDTTSLQHFRDTPVQFLLPSKKRSMSIACGMLTSPAVLIIDDATRGSDFVDGLELLKSLKRYAENMGIIVVLAMNPAPSAYYQVCSKFLFLYKGHISFYGNCSDITGLLTSIGEVVPDGYNPADYLLERLSENTLNDIEPIQERIVHAMYNLRKDPEWQLKVCIDKYPLTTYSKNGKHINNGKEKTMLPITDTATYNMSTSEDNEEALVLLDVDNNSSFLAKGDEKHLKYTTSPGHQFLTLFARNFLNARRRILFPVGVVQNLYILVVCVLIWWQPERNESTVKDRMGLFFFTVVQWAFFSLLDAILTFPKEIAVIKKEVRHNQYCLSLFCLSKTMSELPLAILQPCVYMCVMYWVANLNGIHAFLSSIVVLIVDVLAAQSIGLLVGTVLRPPWTVTVVSLGLLSMMLIGGAFNTPPPWLSWGKFASFFYYGLSAFIVLEFKDAPPIQCIPNSTLPLCNMINPLTNSTFTEFDSSVILKLQTINWSAWEYVSVLMVIMFVTRILWYISMKKQMAKC